VSLPNGVELKAPRFYAPQAGQISFDEEQGVKFANAVLRQAEEELGDVSAAVGPEGGQDIQIQRDRLEEQREILAESPHDAEVIRRVAEEARFIRQDIARAARQHQNALIQRRMGKMTAVFNRVARAKADEAEAARFDNHMEKIQTIIDENDTKLFGDADLHLAEMRDIFFGAAWRDPNYVLTWYKRLCSEPYLFPDQDEFQDMVAEGQKMVAAGDQMGLRRLVSRMLGARIALAASDMASELATIVKG
jgi:hypothetical protein